VRLVGYGEGDHPAQLSGLRQRRGELVEACLELVAASPSAGLAFGVSGRELPLNHPFSVRSVPVRCREPVRAIAGVNEVRPVDTVPHQQHQYAGLGVVIRGQRDEVKADDGRVDQVAGDPPDVAGGSLGDQADPQDAVGRRCASFAGLLDAINEHAAPRVRHGCDVLRQLELLGLLGLRISLRCGQWQLSFPV